MDLLLFQLSFIFLPGLIWSLLDTRFAGRGTPSSADLLIRAFLFGLATYVVVYLIYRMLQADFSLSVLSRAATGSFDINEFMDEVIWSIPASIGLALLYVWISNQKYLERLLHALKITKRYSDEDIWDLTFSSREAGLDYVHVRDFERGLVFAGWVESFSENQRPRELILKDVQVSRMDNVEEVTNVRRVYLSMNPESIYLEFPYIQPTGDGNGNQEG